MEVRTVQYVVVIETGAPIELVEASCRWLPGKVVLGPRALHGPGGIDAAAGLLLQPPWLPDWVVDELPARSRGGVPLLLALKLFRHGTPVVDPETGARRAYWCGQLPRLTGASKRALDAAVAELVSLGVLRVHEPPRAGAARGYSAGYEPPAWGVVPGPGGPGRGVVPALEGGAESATPQVHGGAETAAPSESRAHANGGGGDPDLLPDPEGMEIHHHPSGDSREQILRALRELGVDSPGALLASHGPVRVLGALGELSAELRRGGVRNPAGWLVAALSDRERVFEQAGADVLAHLQRPAETVRRWGLDAVFPEWRERAAALGER
ncbi:MAG: hypothetical protein C3F10_09510 [Dehalococcoidia bacterium]|nr:MAG: hypothetical protein C3F10_09510 [Dehalococcoidia bacterium]